MELNRREMGLVAMAYSSTPGTTEPYRKQNKYRYKCKYKYKTNSSNHHQQQQYQTKNVRTELDD
jgi:hypothetical protein